MQNNTIIFYVNLIESEAGWGSKIDETLFFKDANNAFKFVEDFNIKNNSNSTPDWYMFAEEPKMIKYNELIKCVKKDIKFQDE